MQKRAFAELDDLLLANCSLPDDIRRIIEEAGVTDARNDNIVDRHRRIGYAIDNCDDNIIRKKLRILIRHEYRPPTKEEGGHFLVTVEGSLLDAVVSDKHAFGSFFDNIRIELERSRPHLPLILDEWSVLSNPGGSQRQSFVLKLNHELSKPAKAKITLTRSKSLVKTRYEFSAKLKPILAQNDKSFGESLTIDDACSIVFAYLKSKGLIQRNQIKCDEKLMPLLGVYDLPLSHLKSLLALNLTPCQPIRIDYTLTLSGTDMTAISSSGRSDAEIYNKSGGRCLDVDVDLWDPNCAEHIDSLNEYHEAEALLQDDLFKSYRRYKLFVDSTIREEFSKQINSNTNNSDIDEKIIKEESEVFGVCNDLQDDAHGPHKTILDPLINAKSESGSTTQFYDNSYKSSTYAEPLKSLLEVARGSSNVLRRSGVPLPILSQLEPYIALALRPPTEFDMIAQERRDLKARIASQFAAAQVQCQHLTNLKPKKAKPSSHAAPKDAPVAPEGTGNGGAAESANELPFDDSNFVFTGDSLLLEDSLPELKDDADQLDRFSFGGYDEPVGSANEDAKAAEDFDDDIAEREEDGGSAAVNSNSEAAPQSNPIADLISVKKPLFTNWSAVHMSRGFIDVGDDELFQSAWMKAAMASYASATNIKNG